MVMQIYEIDKKVFLCIIIITSLFKKIYRLCDELF